MSRLISDWQRRFWDQVDRRSDDECWPWTGRMDAYGYGDFDLARSNRLVPARKAHRVALIYHIKNGRAWKNVEVA